MVLKRTSSRVYVRPAIAILLTALASSPLFAQAGIPVAVTLKTSQSIEGRINPVAGYSTQKVPGSSAGSLCYVVDDGHRRIYVGKSQLVNEEPRPLTVTEIEFPIWQDLIEPTKPPFGTLLQAYPFNEFGHRVVRVSAKNTGNHVQAITKITPRYVQLSALKSDGPGAKKPLTMSIGTGAVPVNVIRKLLYNQISRTERPGEYEDIFGYFLRAQQFDEALKELDLIERRFPDRREQVELNRKRVRQSRARQVVREISTRVRNGQTEVSRKLADAMDKDGVAPNLLLELQELLGEIDKAETKVQQVRNEVGELVKRYRANPPKKITAEQEAMLGLFLAELESELTPYNAARLDSYLVQAPDASQKDQEKVALAISGWLMGSNNATPNFALAQSMFTVRELIVEYLNSGNPARHSEILEELKAFESGNNPEFIANMLAQMKPLEHEEATAGYTGEKPIEFTVTVPGTRARPGDQTYRVLVHLPIEYDPYRRYPLLITLPNAGASVEKQLDMFNQSYIENVGRVGRASRNGVIVAAVEWFNRGQDVVSYSSREHLTVLKAMRACFRKFQIDTDRVFLHGHRQGASLVYDIGLAHPEHFAGLIPVAGSIEKYAMVHAKNRGIPLSIYAVVGEGDVETQRVNSAIWTRWLLSSKYVNLFLVEYIGRLANENFPDDIESMFDWMQYQRRRLPDPAGFEFSVKSLRPWDNYFWFLELHGFPRENTMWPETWQDGKLKALPIEGELKPEDPRYSHFILNPAKAGKGMTLWLSADFVDFDSKEVKITGRGKDFVQAVSPSTRVMLDDVRARCDRLHPYWARVDCNSGRWQVVE